MRALLTAAIATAAMTLPGCMTVAKTTGKAVALPFQATYHTGRLVGQGMIGTAEFAGDAVMATGRGVYYVGSVPVRITDRALDTSIKVLTVTTKTVDLAGKVVTTTRQINAAQLDYELSNIRRARNVLEVIIDA